MTSCVQLAAQRAGCLPQEAPSAPASLHGKRAEQRNLVAQRKLDQRFSVRAGGGHGRCFSACASVCRNSAAASRRAGSLRCPPSVVYSGTIEKIVVPEREKPLRVPSTRVDSNVARSNTGSAAKRDRSSAL